MSLPLETSSHYQVQLEEFSGPLELLLHLVREAKLDITEISLAAVANQYFQYLERMQSLDIEIESSYLLVFAQLLELKSRLLLPAAENNCTVGDEAFADILDPCAESFETGETAPLVEKLHVYAMVSEAADWLAKAETNSLSRYVRPKILGSPSQKEQGQASFACELQVSLEALTSAFRRLDKAGHSPERPVSLARVSISVPERMKQLVEKLSASRSCQFRELVDTRIAYVVVTFLALLELIRLGRVYVEQSQPNGDICIHSRRVLGLAGRESQKDGRS